MNRTNISASLGGMIFVGDNHNSDGFNFDLTVSYTSYQHISFYAKGIL